MIGWDLNLICTTCNCDAIRQAAINFMSAWTLMKEDMLLHRASAFEYNALKEAFADCLRGFKYETFPDMMKVKKMPADKAPLPIDKDGQLVWKNFMDFFTGYVEMYYPEGRKKVEDDQELQEYWSSLERATTEHDAEDGTHNGYGLPELSKKSLVEQLAHTAFWVTGMHEVSGSIVEMFESPRALLACSNAASPPTFLLVRMVANDTQYLWRAEHGCGVHLTGRPWMARAGNSATKICQQGEDGYVKEDVNGNIEEIWVGEKRQTMADVQTFFQDMCVIASTGYRLPALMSDWKHLFLPVRLHTSLVTGPALPDKLCTLCHCMPSPCPPALGFMCISATDSYCRPHVFLRACNNHHDT